MGRAVDSFIGRAYAGSSDYLGRWIDLTAHLLTQHVAEDPMREICHELCTRFSAEAAGTVDFSEDRARLGVYRFSGDRPGRYAPVVGDHPLALHYRSTHDPRARALADVDLHPRDPWAGAILESLHGDGLRDFVFLPLRPRDGMRHRWLGLGSGDPLGAAARDEMQRVGGLVRAIDSHSRVMSVAPPCSTDSESGLSGRERAVLVLVSRGLTATAIGAELSISPRTVSKHQQNIYRKLDVSDRVTAVMRAQELGMLRDETASVVRTVTTIEAAVRPRGRAATA